MKDVVVESRMVYMNMQNRADMTKLLSDPRSKGLSIDALLNLTYAKEDAEVDKRLFKDWKECVPFEIMCSPTSGDIPSQVECKVCEKDLSSKSCVTMLRCKCVLHADCVQKMIDLGCGQYCPSCYKPQITGI